MSTSLYWRPVSKDYESLPDQLKQALRKGGETDGTHKRTIDTNECRYLDGLIDAGVDGAKDLKDAVCEYGEVEIWEE